VRKNDQILPVPGYRFLTLFTVSNQTGLVKAAFWPIGLEANFPWQGKGAELTEFEWVKENMRPSGITGFPSTQTGLYLIAKSICSDNLIIPLLKVPSISHRSLSGGRHFYFQLPFGIE
jgi:hypothetical protein